MNYSSKKRESGLPMKHKTKVNILQNEENSVKNKGVLPKLLIRSIPRNKYGPKKTKRNGKGYHWVCVKYSGSVPTSANRCFVKLTPINVSTVSSTISQAQRNQAVKESNAALNGFKTKKSKKTGEQGTSDIIKPCSVVIEPLDLNKYLNSQVTSKKALSKDPRDKTLNITKKCIILAKPLPSELYGILKHCSISVKSVPRESLPYVNNKLSKPFIKTTSILEKQNVVTPNNSKKKSNACTVILQPLSTKVAKTLSPVKIHLPKLPDKLLEYIPENIRKAAASSKKSKLKVGKVFSPKKRSRASKTERGNSNEAPFKKLKKCTLPNLNEENITKDASPKEFKPKAFKVFSPKKRLRASKTERGSSTEPPFKKFKKCTVPNLNEDNITKAASPKESKLKAGKVISTKKRSRTSETEIGPTLRNRRIDTPIKINHKQALDLKIADSNETSFQKLKKSALPNVNKEVRVARKRFVESNKRNLPKIKANTKTSRKKSLVDNTPKKTVKPISTKKQSQIPTTLQNVNENDDLGVLSPTGESGSLETPVIPASQNFQAIFEKFSRSNNPLNQTVMLQNRVRTNWFNNICLPITKFNRKIAELRAQELRYKETASSTTELEALFPSPISRATSSSNNPSTVGQLSVSSTDIRSPTSTAMILRKISELDHSRQSTPTLLSTFFVPRDDNEVVSQVTSDYDTEDDANLISDEPLMSESPAPKTINEVVSDSTSICDLKDKQKNKSGDENGTNLLEAVENGSNYSEEEKSGKEVANFGSNEALGGNDTNSSARNIQTQTEPLDALVPNSWELGKPIGDPKVLLEAWLQWTEMHKNELLYQSF